MSVGSPTQPASGSTNESGQGSSSQEQYSAVNSTGAHNAGPGQPRPKDSAATAASLTNSSNAVIVPQVASPRALVVIGGLLLVASVILLAASFFIHDNTLAVLDGVLCAVAALSVFPFVAPAAGPVRGLCAPVAVLLSAVATILAYLTGLSFLPGDSEVLPAGGTAALAGAVYLVQSYRERRRESRSLREPLGLFTEASNVPRTAERASHVVLVPGDMVAADMVLERGSVAVLERRIDPMPVFRIKDEGEILFAGSQVIGGRGEGTTMSSTTESVLPRLESLARPTILDQESLSAVRRRQAEDLFVLMIALCSVALALLMSEYGAAGALILSSISLLVFLAALPGALDLISSLERTLAVRWARLGLVSRSNGVLERLRSVSSAYIDPQVSEDQSVITVASLDLLDDRISREALCSTLSSLVGRGEEPMYVALSTFCFRQAGNVMPERVLELREYEGRGMCGSVRGVEFSVGSEEFLVDRGIMLQPSDALPAQSGERILYAAIDDDVVGRFRLKTGRSELVTPATWPEAIVSVSTFDQGAPVSNASLVVRSEATPPPEGVDAVNIVLFSAEKFEFPPADLVMLSQDVGVLPTIVHTAYSVRRVERALEIVVYSCGCAGAVAVVLGVGPAHLVAALWIATAWFVARRVKALGRRSANL